MAGYLTSQHSIFALSLIKSLGAEYTKLWDNNLLGGRINSVVKIQSGKEFFNDPHHFYQYFWNFRMDEGIP